MGAPARAHLCAGAAPGRMRVPHRRAGGGGAAPGGAVDPRRKYSGTSQRSRACASICTRPWIRAAAPLPSVSTISGIWASTGRRIRRKRKPGANTSGSGRSSGAARSRSLIELPLMSDPASLATMDVLTKLVAPAGFADANLYFLVLSGRLISASNVATATLLASPMRGSVDGRPALRRLQHRISIRPARL